MSQGEDYVNFLKTGLYKDKYVDIYPLANGVSNPLANIVPLIDDDFFGTKVCNIIVLTGAYIDWDSSSVDQCINRLQTTYDKFVKYETHYIIDGAAPKITCLSDAKKNDMKDRLIELAATLDAYGVSYDGEASDGALISLIDDIFKTFYQ